MAQIPSIGRIVHFYGTNLSPLGTGWNGQGDGPYLAFVTQVFPTADGSVSYANLYVTPPFALPFQQGSVPEKGSKFDTGASYFQFPPYVPSKV